MATAEPTTPKDRDELRDLIRVSLKSARREGLIEVDALLSALDAAGLVVVPREATESMAARGRIIYGSDSAERPLDKSDAYLLSTSGAKRRYAAMLAASPYTERSEG